MTRILVDLSHPITAGMTTYPGLPGPVVETHISREESGARMAPGVSFHMARISMVANTGTYIDAPYHFHDTGPDISGLALERLVDVPAVVVEATDRQSVGADAFAGLGSLAGTAVLVRTGWSRLWGTEAYLATDSPHLTADAVDLLVEEGPALVGIDSLNIDAVPDLSRPAHHGLLGAGIPVVEHLTGLDALPARGARLTVLPAPVVGMGTMPVRAVAVLDV